MRTIKVAYSGIGTTFDKNHLPSIQKIEEFQIILGYDLRKLSNPEIRKCNSFEELVKKLKEYHQKLLVITSPDNVHYNQATIAINEGIDIFSEKPMAITIPQCMNLRNKIKKTNIIYMINLQGIEYPKVKLARTLFQKEFANQDLSNLMAEAGYYHNLLPLFNPLHQEGSSFHMKQNYHLGGGIHALSSILFITNASVKEVDGVNFECNYSNKNPIKYSGLMTLTNGINLNLITDITPENKQREQCKIYFSIKEKNGKTVLETRVNEEGNEIINFKGEDYILEKDREALVRIYKVLSSSIRTRQLNFVNDVDFAYNCTVPIIESLDKGKVPRTDLEDIL